MAEKRKTSTSKTAPVQAVKAGDIGLVSDVKRLSRMAFAVAIRVLQQNWRQGTVGVLDRSEVSYSNKKPWKQKGTGRARAGSAKSPLWRKGGVIFGPQPRVRTLSANVEMNKGVLRTLCLSFLDKGAIVYANWDIAGDVPRTGEAYALLKTAQLLDKPVVLFLPKDDELMYQSFINIPFVKILFFDQPNAFDMAKSSCWLVLKKHEDSFKKMVQQWL